MQCSSYQFQTSGGNISLLSKIKKVSEASFIPWRDEIINRIENKIHFAKRSCTFSDPKSVLDDPVAKKDLKSLHNNYLLIKLAIMLSLYVNITMLLPYSMWQILM